ncbi:hypothetical protein LTS08_003129 [Lithohypha guttulata]|nr:hypothetical protein LTS08_003129 [Lithohypha guttulata]
MASPPPQHSDGLFFSSSPTQIIPGPDQEVEELVRRAQKISQLDLCLEDVLSNNRIEFFSSFRRQLELIKSRSQVFQDCHVTVYDKTLLVLTRNGNNMNNPSAVVFYCEEFLAIPMSLSPIQKESLLKSSLVAPVALSEVHSAPQLQQGPVPTKGGRSLSPDKKRLFKKDRQEQKPAIFAILAAQVGDAALRLWTVYEKAKEDFFAISDSNSFDKQAAAKFLRDTAENTLEYLADKDPGQQLLDELKMTLAVAKHTAMTLHGGKKRKFDEPLASRDTYRGNPARVTRRERLHEIRANDKLADRVQPRAKNDRFDLFDGHARALEHRQRPRSRERMSDRRQFFAPEISPKDMRTSKRRQNQYPGRGHSGIPFGYTRPVDSYCPGSG